MASDILELPAGAEQVPRTIELPAPTAWPIVLAFGFTLVFAGLVTSVSVSLLGTIFALAGCVGWFRDVLPNEKHESVSVAEKTPAVATSRLQVVRVEWMTQELHRALARRGVRYLFLGKSAAILLGFPDTTQDVDVFRFDGKEGQAVVIEVFAARYGSPLDSFLTLYTADGQIVASNDDHAGSADSLIETTLPKSGAYYVSVIDANDQGGPAYVYRLAVRAR